MNGVNEQEAARILQVSPRTLQAWRRKGRGPGYVKAGTKVIYPQVLLEEWLAGRLVLTKEAQAA